jgi:hypothetical protein
MVHSRKDEALALVLQVLHTVDAWVKTLTDEEDKVVAEPVLAIAKQVEAQDVQISEKGNVSLVKGWPKIDASVSKMGRCDMDAKVGACGWTDRSGMCSTIWTRVSSERRESRQPMPPKPV